MVAFKNVGTFKLHIKFYDLNSRMFIILCALKPDKLVIFPDTAIVLCLHVHYKLR